MIYIDNLENIHQFPCKKSSKQETRLAIKETKQRKKKLCIDHIGGIVMAQGGNSLKCF